MILLYLLFVGGGIYQILQESVGYLPNVGLSNNNGRYYIEILKQKGFIFNLIFSLYVALVASFLSMLFGVMTAYFYMRMEEKLLKKITYGILQMGLMIPYLFVIFFAMIFLGKTGLVSRFLYHIGMIKDFTQFPTLVFDQIGFGILWVYVCKGTPFVALFTINSMMRISSTYAEVGKTLGAKDFTVFKKIYVPLCAKTIVWSTVVLFAYDLGAFEVPYLLSPISPLPLSAELYSLYSQLDVEGMSKAMAMSVIILLSGGLVGSVYALGLHWMLRGKGR